MAKKGKCFESSRLCKIGVTGFEPAASCSQSRRSIQAELHPEKPGIFDRITGCTYNLLRDLFC